MHIINSYKTNKSLVYLGEATILAKTRKPTTTILIRFYNKHKSPSPLPELFPQRLILPENHGYVPLLTRQQINTLLCTYRTLGGHVPGQRAIKDWDSNELSSNVPIEDRRAQARYFKKPNILVSQ